MEEIWKPIVEYENLYEISNFGRVKRLKRTEKRNPYYRNEKLIKGYLKVLDEKILNPSNNGLGYFQITLRKDSSEKKFYIHRLVYSVFIDKIPKDKEINHINHIKSDNNVNNLEILSRQENMKKMFIFHDNVAVSNYCLDCSKKILKDSIRCNSCSSKNKGFEKRKNRPSKETLVHEKSLYNYSLLGRKYKVSPNTIKQWLKDYEAI